MYERKCFRTAAVAVAIISWGVISIPVHAENGSNSLDAKVDQLLAVQQKNRVTAEKAFQRAQKEAQKNNAELTLIFTLNALHHDPANIAYIRFYRDLQDKSMDAAAVEQFIAILDLAIYQVEADEIEELLNIKKKMEARHNELIEKDVVEKQKTNKKQLAENMQQLKNNFPISKIVQGASIDKDLLNDRIELLNSVLSDTTLTEEERKTYSEALREATGLYPISAILSAVEKTQKKMEDIAKRDALSLRDFMIAKTQIQVAVSQLAPLWNLDEAQYSVFVEKGKVDLQKLMDIEEKINEIASRPAQKEIEARLQKITNIYEEGLKPNMRDAMARIEMILEEAAPINGLMQEIYSSKIRQDLMLKSGVIQKYIEKFRERANRLVMLERATRQAELIR